MRSPCIDVVHAVSIVPGNHADTSSPVPGGTTTTTYYSLMCPSAHKALCIAIYARDYVSKSDTPVPFYAYTIETLCVLIGYIRFPVIRYSFFVAIRLFFVPDVAIHQVAWVTMPLFCT